MNKWSGNKRNNVPRMANNALGNTSNEQSVAVSAQQLDQLLKLIPQMGKSGVQESETDEEIDFAISGMVNSGKEKMTGGMEWIIDSGASDHMTSSLKNLVNVKLAPSRFTITLPTGATAVITHVGDVTLPNGLRLKNVLHVPQFHHNLLSIHKLAKDEKCEVMFQLEKCCIMDSTSKKVIGVGKLKNGLYYLQNERQGVQALAMTSLKLKEKSGNKYTIWHQRLGHAPVSKL